MKDSQSSLGLNFNEAFYYFFIPSKTAHPLSVASTFSMAEVAAD